MEGLEGLQTYQYVAPEISVYFDEERQRYICDMVSRSGVYQLEGVDNNDITYQIDKILRTEYTEWAKSLEHDKNTPSMSAPIGSQRKRERILGHEVHSTTGTGRSIGGIGTLIEATLGLSAVKSGRYGEGIFSLMTMAFGDWFGGVLNVFGIKVARKKLFYASVGGVIVAAKSKKKLKKKLILQRNKHVQKIMHNVRVHKRITNRLHVNRITKAAYRIKQKKAFAEEIGRKTWRDKIGVDAEPKKDWKGRVKSLKTRVQSRKEAATGEWTKL